MHPGRSIKINLMPFENIEAIGDLSTNEIFLNQNSDILENLGHELAHILSGDPDHGPEFRSVCDSLGVRQPPEDDVFKRFKDRFGVNENLCANVGNVTGIQNLLTDYHLLQAYRKFSQKILGTEGHWEVIGEVDGESKDQLIRLYPTPKGVFPVVVVYYPTVYHFRSPQAKKLAMDMMLAESKCMLGYARRKLTGMPTPDGGSINYDGDSLVTEGNEAKEKIIEQAISLGEPLPFFLF